MQFYWHSKIRFSSLPQGGSIHFTKECSSVRTVMSSSYHSKRMLWAVSFTSVLKCINPQSTTNIAVAGLDANRWDERTHAEVLDHHSVEYACATTLLKFRVVNLISVGLRSPRGDGLLVQQTCWPFAWTGKGSIFTQSVLKAVDAGRGIRQVTQGPAKQWPKDHVSAR